MKLSFVGVVLVEKLRGQGHDVRDFGSLSKRLLQNRRFAPLQRIDGERSDARRKGRGRKLLQGPDPAREHGLFGELAEPKAQIDNVGHRPILKLPERQGKRFESAGWMEVAQD